ncbi:MAG TPA: hypothetical protein VFU00_11470 [Gemmatimonadales bacterium]|nr:hypothetical protein [Gemmatimonadales bacterium]
MADALLGNGERAVAEAEAIVRDYKVERDAVEGADMVRWLAATYALAGRREEAIATLRRVMGQPGSQGSGDLRLNPIWDGLRGGPEFEAMSREQ